MSRLSPAQDHEADGAAWLLSRPWSLPTWQRRICESILAAIGQPHRRPLAQPWLPLWGI